MLLILQVGLLREIIRCRIGDVKVPGWVFVIVLVLTVPVVSTAKPNGNSYYCYYSNNHYYADTTYIKTYFVSLFSYLLLHVFTWNFEPLDKNFALGATACWTACMLRRCT